MDRLDAFMGIERDGFYSLICTRERERDYHLQVWRGEREGEMDSIHSCRFIRQENESKRWIDGEMDSLHVY
jgi:hypothetical protein